MEHDDDWHEARRREIRWLSILLTVLFFTLAGSYFIGRATGDYIRFLRQDPRHHVELEEARQRVRVCWVIFMTSVIGGLLACKKRGALVKRYNEIVLQDDPMLRGDHIPIVK